MSRSVTGERVLIVSQGNRINFFDIDKIAAVSAEPYYGSTGEVYIVYDKSSYSFSHPKGYQFLFSHLKSILIDLKTGKQTFAIVEIEEV